MEKSNLSTTDTIAQVVDNIPPWLRKELMSKDAAQRTRAEGSLAAIIAAALNAQPQQILMQVFVEDAEGR